MQGLRKCHAVCSLVMIALVVGCEGKSVESQIVSDVTKYMAFADAGNGHGAYQRLSSAARKYIPEAEYVGLMKLPSGQKSSTRNINVLGVWNNAALVQYEIASGTGPWESANGFYTREPGGWMRAFTHPLTERLAEAKRHGDSVAQETILLQLAEVSPDPMSHLSLCTFYHKRGDRRNAVRACQMVVDAAENFPLRPYRDMRVLAHEMLAGLFRENMDFASERREVSAALELLDKYKDLDREREASLRFRRLGNYIHQVSGDLARLSAPEWELVEDDWKKLRGLCEAGPCSGLRADIHELMPEMESLLARRTRAASDRHSSKSPSGPKKDPVSSLSRDSQSAVADLCSEICPGAPSWRNERDDPLTESRNTMVVRGQKICSIMCTCANSENPAALCPRFKEPEHLSMALYVTALNTEDDSASRVRSSLLDLVKAKR